MESMFRREMVKLSTLTNLSHLTTGTKNHLRNVYACLSIALVFASAGAYLNMMNAFIAGRSFISLIATVGLMFWLFSTPHTKKNLNKRLAILSGIGFFVGADTAPLLNLAVRINPSLIVTAFLTTSSIFVCFTLSALFARRRTYLFLGGILSTACMVMLFSVLFRGFMSIGMMKFYIYAGAALTVAFVLYDTQVIIERYMNGDDDFIKHSVDLFLDFIQLFRYLLVILSMNENDKKRKRRC